MALANKGIQIFIVSLFVSDIYFVGDSLIPLLIAFVISTKF